MPLWGLAINKNLGKIKAFLKNLRSLKVLRKKAGKKIAQALEMGFLHAVG